MINRDLPTATLGSEWAFLAGDETDAYLDDARTFEIYGVNTIMDYDIAILPKLDAPPGSYLRRRGGAFVVEA